MTAPPTALPNLTIDADRLWADIMATAAFGGTEKGGIRRLALSAEDKAVRDWFTAEAEALGCTVKVDEIGTQFALYPGKDMNQPPIAMGSHLDTQPTGGKFDGVLGVLAGLAVLRAVHAAGFVPDRPLMVVNWTNEEGSRFQPGMAASGVHSGHFNRDWVYNGRDPEGVRFQDALQAIGYLGDQAACSQPFGAFLELHIEQGPLLEAASEQIGIVTGVQGIRWFEVSLAGFENHAGTTPMHLRRDAMVGAAKLTLAVNELALGYGGRAVGTVGRIAITPGSPNVIPGDVRFTIDFRSPELTIIDDFEAKLRAHAAVVAGEHGLDVTVQQVNQSTPVAFDQRCIEAVRAGTDRFGFACREMMSGAGHDAAHISAVAPTSMIFIPCKDGVSHNEAESATKADCAAGANVLLHAALSLAAAG